THWAEIELASHRLTNQFGFQIALGEVVVVSWQRPQFVAANVMEELEPETEDEK
ncbi:hypothetical protein BaRGS_00005569, partial [Batillaria attramentaria]